MNRSDLTAEEMDWIDMLADIATPIPHIAEEVGISEEAVEAYLYGAEPR